MEKGIVAGALFLSTFLTPAPSQTPSQKSQTPKDESKVYVVKKGDSLTSIAQNQYGDENYWTNLWNDNPWIKDSSDIEENWKLKIENKKTDEPQSLDDKLIKTQIANNVIVSSSVETNIQTQATTTPTPNPQQPAQPQTTPNSLTDDQLNFLGSCESGMTASRNSGNGFYGAFQFSPGTWNSMGTGYDRADLAPIDVQKDAVRRLVARSNIYGQFPGCAARMRNSGLIQ